MLRQQTALREHLLTSRDVALRYSRRGALCVRRTRHKLLLEARRPLATAGDQSGIRCRHATDPTGDGQRTTPPPGPQAPCL